VSLAEHRRGVESPGRLVIDTARLDVEDSVRRILVVAESPGDRREAKPAAVRESGAAN
jgi:hypothetical protein